MTALYNGLPRIVLLTNWRPDGRYAGAEFIRRMVSRLPADRVRWVSLQGIDCKGVAGVSEHKTFPLQSLHWRLVDSAPDAWMRYEVQAPAAAARIADWLREFRPQILWVLPELGAINVGFHLASRLKLPVHATLYDAPESAQQVCIPRLYARRYHRTVQRFFARFASADVISQPLLDHVRGAGMVREACRLLVYPPAVSRDWMLPAVDFDREGSRVFPSSGIRRIGFCGAFRVGPAQWQAFLDRLRDLPFQFELVAFAAPDSIPAAVLPSNVRIDWQAYVAQESDLIRAFRARGVCAAYLGLWNEPERGLFCRTSLSSKLTAYAAAALPVIVDGPRDSAAWALVGKYGAGIRLEDAEQDAETLGRFFAGGDSWVRQSEGAMRLCREEFDLERNLEQWVTLVSRAAEPAPGSR